MIAEAVDDPPGRHAGAVPRSGRSSGGFVSIDGERYARIDDVDAMPPFLMSVVSDSDVWLFVGSNGAFTAGRRDADHAHLPEPDGGQDPARRQCRRAQHVPRLARRARQPLGALARHRLASARCSGTSTSAWTAPRSSSRRSPRAWACGSAGASRPARASAWSGTPSSTRSRASPSPSATSTAGTSCSRPGWTATCMRASAIWPSPTCATSACQARPLALYTLNTMVSDRPEPSESLRVASAWTVGHTDPRILLSDAPGGDLPSRR